MPAEGARVTHVCRWMSSSLSLASQLSATALFQHCPGRDRLCRVFASPSAFRKSSGAYCEARSSASPPARVPCACATWPPPRSETS